MKYFQISRTLREKYNYNLTKTFENLQYFILFLILILAQKTTGLGRSAALKKDQF